MRLIALLLFIPQFALAECDIHSFLKSVLYEKSEAVYLTQRAFDPKDPVLREARSAWGKSAEIKALQKDFDELNFLHSPRPLMPVYKGSYAEKSPELIRIIDDINRLQMNPKQFEEQFRRAFDYSPQRSDYYDFYSSRMEVLASGVEEYIREMKKLDPDLAKIVHGNFLDQTGRRHEMIEKIMRSEDVSEISGRAEGMNGLMRGFLAELYATASMPNVKKMGMKLSQLQDVNDLIKDRLQGVLHEVNNNPKALEKFNRQYPRIFENSAMHHSHFKDHQERFARIQAWIKSKEIDLVREQGGKTRWVEIKRNRTTFDLDYFKHRNKRVQAENREVVKLDAGGNDLPTKIEEKSLFDQILEDKEIIEFLGLSDKIQLEYLATGGVTPEVQALLEKNGIKVILAH